MSLTLYERETIINYNEAEDTAGVYTCSRSLIRKLNRLMERSEDIKVTEETKISKTYTTPK